jgi:uroporphyrinogen-III synthase
MQLMLTRPEADAARTATALRARGHDVLIASLLRIETVPDAALGTGPWSAILVTSANAVRAIADHPRRSELNDIPVIAVGRHSARAMREAGFTNVSSADGNVFDLAKLAAARMEPAARLLYLASEERSGDLAGVLRAQDFTVDTALVYRAVAADAFPIEAAAALKTGIDGVLHFSRRSAEAYVSAAHNGGLLGQALAGPVHYCLSARVAEPLTEADAVRVRIAARPDEAALIELCG